MTMNEAEAKDVGKIKAMSLCPDSASSLATLPVLVVDVKLVSYHSSNLTPISPGQTMVLMVLGAAYLWWEPGARGCR